jgi:hypothetical protein
MIPDEKRIKAQSLAFARTFQSCVRTSITFGVAHPPTVVQMQQGFDALNVLLKQYGQFTLGFVDQRILLNKVLTTDKNLLPLENEFGKRGIGAITFDVGVTFADFCRCVEIMSAAPTSIVEEGGIAAYTYKREIPKVRIVPAPKGQRRTDSGDIVVETDVDSLLASRSAPKLGGLAGTDILELILRSGGVAQPAAFDGSPQASLSLVRTSVQGALVSEHGDPMQSYQALARMLQELRPEFMLTAFPSKRQEELKKMAPDQIAAEFMEDTALQWAVQQLVSAPSSSDAFVVEREVISVLLRCLKATNTAERLAWKIEELFREYYLPMGTYDRIREELEWHQQPMRRRQEDLGRVKRFNVFTARRMHDLTKELIEHGVTNGASEVVQHYFQTLAQAGETLQPEEIEWAQTLLVLAANLSTAVHYGIQVLMSPLASSHLTAIHAEIAECMVRAAQSASVFEDYETVLMVGASLDARMSVDSHKHAACCGIHLRNLMPPNSIERVIEITIERRNDANWVKSAMKLWSYGGPLSVELLLDRLEHESDAKIRLFLIRQLGQMQHSMELVRQRLHDDKWYVVRNACVVLGEMKDPELLDQLGPLLRHSHDRVQETVFQAIERSRRPERAVIFADSLNALRGRLLEQALDEIFFLKNPKALPGLRQFITAQKPGMALNKALQTLASIPGDDTFRALGYILGDSRLDMSTRRFAMASLLRSSEPFAQRLMQRFVETFPGDPLAQEAQRTKSTSAR